MLVAKVMVSRDSILELELEYEGNEGELTKANIKAAANFLSICHSCLETLFDGSSSISSWSFSVLKNKTAGRKLPAV